MKLTFLGHAAFKLEGSQTIYIDPFLTGNPSASMSLPEATKADLVLVTHDHGDHLGDAVAICKQTGATLVSIHETATAMAATGGIKAEGMNIGGTLIFGGVKIHMVEAQHSSE
ncbi:MAG: MBL fold metallo-hydrolase, partial [bacterium]|nr:MBL fold metallo-hydrolase [bacterium]